MQTEKDLKKQIEKLQKELKQKHEEKIILHAIIRALQKLRENRVEKEEENKLEDLEEKLKNI